MSWSKMFHHPYLHWYCSPAEVAYFFDRTHH